MGRTDMINSSLSEEFFEQRRTELCSSADTRVSGKPSTVKIWSRALIVAAVFVNSIDITSDHVDCESAYTKYVTPLRRPAKSA